MPTHSDFPTKVWKAAVILGWLYGALAVLLIIEVLLVASHPPPGADGLEGLPLLLLGAPWSFVLLSLDVAKRFESLTSFVLITGACCALNLCLYLASSHFAGSQAGAAGQPSSREVSVRRYDPGLAIRRRWRAGQRDQIADGG